MPASSNFRVLFNKNKQWIEVYLWDVHPNTFASWKAGRWAYFLPTWENPRCGHFGELHFVKGRLRFDTISHEIQHALMEWLWQGGETFTRRNEERLIGYSDKMIWRFLRELKKVEPKAKLW